eukprot:2578023-Rhodomonas_salina.1
MAQFCTAEEQGMLFPSVSRQPSTLSERSIADTEVEFDGQPDAGFANKTNLFPSQGPSFRDLDCVDAVPPSACKPVDLTFSSTSQRLMRRGVQYGSGSSPVEPRPSSADSIKLQEFGRMYGDHTLAALSSTYERHNLFSPPGSI